MAENSPVCCRLHLERAISQSQLVQDITLYPHSRRIDFATHIDWHEQHVLLKAAFPVDICADRAQYDIQFGSIARDTHTNTSWTRPASRSAPTSGLTCPNRATVRRC